MTRPGLPATALLAALLTSPSHGQVPTFPSAVELVTVDAVVLAENGRPVRGLTRDDFVLTEDGKAQEIVSFEGFDLAELADEPRARPSPVASNARSPEARAGAFVLLVDDVGIDVMRLPRLVKALSGVLETAFRAGDEVTLATASGSLWWGVRFPEGREDLPVLLERAKARKFPEMGEDYMSDYEAYQISNHERLGIGPNADFLPPYLGRVVRRWTGTAGCVSDRVDSCAYQVQARATERDSERKARTLALVAAVERAVFSLTAVRGRKELLLFSEGFLGDLGLQEVRQVAGICREANVVVNFLDARGNVSGFPEGSAAFTGNPPDVVDMGAAALERRQDEIGGALGLTEDTGGVAITGTDEFAAGTRRILEESRVYYMLGYHPPAGKGPRDWRKLKVEVKRPGTTVRSRKGYTLRPPGAAEAAQLAQRSKDKAEKAKKAPDPRSRSIEVDRALLNTHDSGAIPLRAMPYLLDERTPGKVRVQMAIDVDESALGSGAPGGGGRATLHLAVQAANRDSGEAFRDDKRFAVSVPSSRPPGWTTLHHDLDLAPGVVQVRVVVREEASGRMGAVTSRFDVPPLLGLRLATPILTDELREPLQKGSRPQLVIPARRVFRTTTGSLYCQVQVLGAVSSSKEGGVPQVEAAYVLRRASGTEVSRGAPSLITAVPGGPVVRLLGLPLGGLSDGDYELVLRALDRTTGSGVERVEPFRLERNTGG